MLVINQNMIYEYKKIMKEMQGLSQTTNTTKSEMLRTQETVKDVVTEMSIFAKKDQLKVLEKYIDLLNIMNFVTEDELSKKLERFKFDAKNPKIGTNVKEVDKIARR
jgi:hypothetical protein